MTKLGNDPFKRGAPVRPAEIPPGGFAAASEYSAPPPAVQAPETENRPPLRVVDPAPEQPAPAPPTPGIAARGARRLEGAFLGALESLAKLLSQPETAVLHPPPERDVPGVINKLLEVGRALMPQRSSAIARDPVDDFGRDAALEARLRPAMEFLYRRYFRVQTRGLEHVPERGRALLVCNHAGALPYDAAMVKAAVTFDHPARRDVRPLLEDFVFHMPYLGVLVNRLGFVRACQENGERLLAQNELVAVFPEGVKGLGKLYRHRYELQRFGRGGFVKLCLRTGTPIIPVAIVGAEETHPTLAKLSLPLHAMPYLPVTPTFPLLGPLGLVPLPARWWIVFGEPIDLGRHGPTAADDRILVNRISEQVRATIQGMVDRVLEERRSVFLG